MKKADTTQALAEQAADAITQAGFKPSFYAVMRLTPEEITEVIAANRYVAGVNLAVINHINGVSPTQE